MKKLIDIILETVDGVSDDINRIKIAMSFMEFYLGQLEKLIGLGGTVYGDNYIKYAINMLNGIKDGLANKIVNLSKDVNIELFERGGNTLEKIGIGFGNPVEDIIKEYEHSASTAKALFGTADNKYTYDKLAGLYKKDGVTRIWRKFIKSREQIAREIAPYFTKQFITSYGNEYGWGDGDGFYANHDFFISK